MGDTTTPTTSTPSLLGENSLIAKGRKAYKPSLGSSNFNFFSEDMQGLNLTVAFKAKANDDVNLTTDDTIFA